MSEFFRYQDKEFPELQECIKYISENRSGDKLEYIIERVFVTNKDQWGSYSETVQEIQFRLRDPAS